MFGKKLWGAANRSALPTVRFDQSLVTDVIKADQWAAILEFEDLPYGEEHAIYDAAVRSIAVGHDLSILARALTQLGVSAGRAGEVSRYLNSRAATLMSVERFQSLGYEKAKWLHAGTPCYDASPTRQDVQRDQGHRLASGRVYPLSEGMLIDGRCTHPGLEMGCKCVFGPAIAGIDY